MQQSNSTIFYPSHPKELNILARTQSYDTLAALLFQSPALAKFLIPAYLFVVLFILMGPAGLVYSLFRFSFLNLLQFNQKKAGPVRKRSSLFQVKTRKDKVIVVA